MSEEPDLPTLKSFSLTFAAVFLIVGCAPWILRGDAPYYWALALAVVIAATGFYAPGLLRPFNWLWFRFGLLLHRIVNPIIILLIYCLGVVPIGLIMRLRGKDLLRLKKQPDAASYWIMREPPGPAPGSMKKQF